jgi:hypothetical protein
MMVEATTRSLPRMALRQRLSLFDPTQYRNPAGHSLPC